MPFEHNNYLLDPNPSDTFNLSERVNCLVVDYMKHIAPNVKDAQVKAVGRHLLKNEKLSHWSFTTVDDIKDMCRQISNLNDLITLR